MPGSMSNTVVQLSSDDVPVYLDRSSHSIDARGPLAPVVEWRRRLRGGDGAVYQGVLAVVDGSVGGRAGPVARDLVAYLARIDRVLNGTAALDYRGRRMHSVARNVTLFPSEAELERLIASEEYASLDPLEAQVFCAVVFTGPTAYKIRINSTDLGSTDSRPEDQSAAANLAGGPGAMRNYQPQSYFSTFLRVQVMVDSFLASRAAGRDVRMEVGVASFPVAARTVDVFWTLGQDTYDFAFIALMVMSIYSLVREVVVEKETKIRETMLMMGLTRSLFLLSWVATYLVVFALIALGVALAGLRLFTSSSASVIFALFLLYGISLIPYCLCVTTLFSKSKTATTWGSLVFILLSYLRFLVQDPAVSFARRRAFSLIPPIAFSQGFKVVCTLEAAGVGAHWSNLGQHHNNFSVAAAMGMLLLDTALLAAIFAYLDRVVPNEFGVPLPWYFPVSPDFWVGGTAVRSLFHRVGLFGFARGYANLGPAAGAEIELGDTAASGAAEGSPSPSSSSSSSSPSQAGGSVQPPSAEQAALAAAGRCIRVRSLTKVYPASRGCSAKTALDGLDADMYAGEITCLLGPNGSGKSTLFSVLTGLIAPTSGEASVMGHAVDSDMAGVRSQLGVCPQQNVLWGELSVREHLEIFASFKDDSLRGAALRDNVNAVIRDVGLEDKASTPAVKLSGGMKRKLCVGLALVGNSAVLLLDEPTSGLDTTARRKLWDLLLRVRQNSARTVILCTHYLDEAEFLGDRIVILANGTLACAGTSLFLKAYYNVGYCLAVVLRPGQAGDELAAAVASLAPEAVPSAAPPGQASFQLPLASSAIFPSLLRQVAALPSVLSYALSVTSLDEVFAKVGSGGALAGSLPAPELPAVAVAEAASEGLDAGDLAAYSVTGFALWRQQVWAGLVKRARISFRDRKNAMFTVVVPCISLFLGFWLITAGILSGKTYVIPLGPANLVSAYNDAGVIAPTWTWATRAAEPLASLVPRGQSILTAPSASEAGLQPLRDPQTPANVNAMLRFLLHERLRHPPAYLAVQLYTPDGLSLQQPQARPPVLRFTVYHNESAAHALPVAVNSASVTLLRWASGDPNATITPFNHPLPLTARERSLLRSVSGMIVAFIVDTAFSFVLAAFAGFVVKERESLSKYQQLLAGLAPSAYWASTMLYDTLSLLPASLVALGAIASLRLKDFQQEGAMAATLSLFFMFAVASGPHAYAASFLFTKHATAQSALSSFSQLCSFVFTVASIVMRFLAPPFSMVLPAWKVEMWDIIFGLTLPIFNLSRGLFAMTLRRLLRSVGFPTGRVWDWDEAGKYIFLLFAQVVIYSAFTLLAERFGGRLSRLLRPRVPYRAQPGPGEPVAVEDADVAAERARVDAGGAESDYIVVRHLQKAFRGWWPWSPVKVAVQSLTLGVPRGQAIALLGVNGAGKTSALACIVGEQAPTHGSVHVGGLDMVVHRDKVREGLGFCSQADSYEELLTVREHLALFVAIKGAPAAVRGTLIGALMEAYDLAAYADKRAGTLSGGNKRKLQIALAMVGRPQLCVLDEPCAGVDPIARRAVLSSVATMAARGCTVILVSHDLSEVEGLCGERIAIMSAGRLRAIGSSAHLKSRFGRDFVVDVRVLDPDPERVAAIAQRCAAGTSALVGLAAVQAACAALGNPGRVAELRPGGAGGVLASTLARDGFLTAEAFASFWATADDHHAVASTLVGPEARVVRVLETHGTRLVLELAADNTDATSLPTLFSLLEHSKQHLRIKEYSVSSKSLEMIFNIFASEVPPPPEDM
jgi:ATP-binding cassette subfamily A (ABC1) protein 3